VTNTVGIYCRISIDKRGRREGVDAQEKWGREYAAEHWPACPVRVFVDNNLSAARDDVRPGYDQLRAAVRAGEITHLWCVEQSRLERRVTGSDGHWFELAAELDSAGITELHTNRDGIVQVGSEVSGIKAVLAAAEVRRIKRRVNDRLDERAAQGLPAGSRYFGYRRGVDDAGQPTLVIEPSEAESVRWAADAVLSGWSLTNITKELQRRGHHGAHGGRLHPSSVSRMLTSPAMAGLRVHRGEIVGPGVWPPILTEDMWQAVRAKLAGSRSVHVPANAGDVTGKGRRGAGRTITAGGVGSRPARKYVITGGLARCGVCGAAMVGAAKTLRNGDRRPYLSCAQTAGGRGCIGIMLDATEEHVADRLFAELDKPEFLAALGTDDHAGRRDELARTLSALDAQRAELAGMWAGGSMSTLEWQAARGGLDRREQTLRGELAAIPAPPRLIDIGDVRSAWPAMTLDERRELLRMFIDTVVISPATPGARAFDSGRVDIVWRSQ
jgi:site-specific DNA recombinase